MVGDYSSIDLENLVPNSPSRKAIFGRQKSLDDQECGQRADTEDIRLSTAAVRCLELPQVRKMRQRVDDDAKK